MVLITGLFSILVDRARFIQIFYTERGAIRWPRGIGPIHSITTAPNCSIVTTLNHATSTLLTRGEALTFCTASRSRFGTSRTAWVFWSPEWLQRKLSKPSSLLSNYCHVLSLCLVACINRIDRLTLRPSTLRQKVSFKLMQSHLLFG